MGLKPPFLVPVSSCLPFFPHFIFGEPPLVVSLGSTMGNEYLRPEMSENVLRLASHWINRLSAKLSVVNCSEALLRHYPTGSNLSTLMLRSLSPFWLSLFCMWVSFSSPQYFSIFSLSPVIEASQRCAFSPTLLGMGAFKIWKLMILNSGKFTWIINLIITL